MDVKLKAALAVLPFLAAGGIVFALDMPAYDEFQSKSKQVDDKKQEQSDLQKQLSNKGKILKEQKALENEIEGLRAAVPKKPDIEILNMDIERMCNESGMDLISFKTAEKEALKKAGLDSEITPETAGTNMSKGKEMLASRVKDTLGGGAKAGAGAKKEAGVSPDGGLSKLTFEIKVIGDYANTMNLVKSLESYQRVVAVTQITTHVPKYDKSLMTKTKAELPDEAVPAEGEGEGDFKKLQSTLFLTAYYLP